MDLAQNPFHILGATPDDPADRLHALAQGGAPAKKAALLVLTDPARRLEAEIAWLPGLNSREAESVVARTLQPPAKPDFGIAGLALCNTLASSLGRLPENAALADYLALLSKTFDAIDPETLARTINEARRRARIPLIQPGQAFSRALASRGAWFFRSAMAALDKLESAAIAETLAQAARMGGGSRLPGLMRAVIDEFDLLSRPFQLAEENNIHITLDKISEALKRSRRNAPRLAELLRRICANRARILAPVALKAKNAGLVFHADLRLAARLRNFALGHPEVRAEILDIVKESFQADCRKPEG